jgi:hypothetical protein
MKPFSGFHDAKVKPPAINNGLILSVLLFARSSFVDPRLSLETTATGDCDGG